MNRSADLFAMALLLTGEHANSFPAGKLGNYLWLQSCRVNTISMKTLHDDLSFLREALDSLSVNNYVSRSNGLVLIEPPDM